MSAPQSFERIILKVLKGVQAGAEVSLIPGEYSVGTGDDDDIQLIDVSVKAGQARIRIRAGTIEIAGGAGSVLLGSGETLPPRSDFQEIEPLDVIEFGMVRFVLGPPNANWSTLIDKPDEGEQGTRGQKKVRGGWLAAGDPSRELYVRQLVLPLLLSIALIGAGIWYVSGDEGNAPKPMTSAENQKILRAALDRFPFGKAIELRVEADGTLFAEGLVQTNFERRALVQAVEKIGGHVNFRLGVVEALNSEIDGLIRSENLSVTFNLSPNGVLTLKGVVLDAKVANSFVDRMKVGVIGLQSVVSEIKTAESFLQEIQELSRLAEINSYVILRLDGELIEASGILPTNRIDRWEDFLQAYVRRFANDIGLRSFVQLQSPDGTFTTANAGKIRPVIISGKKRADDDIVLDAGKLAQGTYQTADFFAHQDKSLSTGTPNASSGTDALDQAQPPSSAQNPSEAVAAHLSTLNPPPSFDAEHMAQAGNDLITEWMSAKRTPSQDDDLTKLVRARMKLGPQGRDDAQSSDVTDRRTAAAQYFPLFSTRQAAAPADACRVGSRLTQGNVSLALFWLDLLSVSGTYSLKTFKREEQAFILEAALNPTLARQCLLKQNKQLRIYSVYLAEMEHNPAFVRFLTRHFSSYPMDVTGASLTDLRYVQIRNGQKVGEGGAPDTQSRLAIVGEIGAAVQRKEGFWTVIYNPSLTWLSRN